MIQEKGKFSPGTTSKISPKSILKLKLKEMINKGHFETVTKQAMKSGKSKKEEQRDKNKVDGKNDIYRNKKEIAVGKEKK